MLPSTTQYQTLALLCAGKPINLTLSFAYFISAFLNKSKYCCYLSCQVPGYVEHVAVSWRPPDIATIRSSDCLGLSQMCHRKRGLL